MCLNALISWCKRSNVPQKIYILSINKSLLLLLLLLLFITQVFWKRDPTAKWDDNRKFKLKSKKIGFIYLFYSIFSEISILIFWTRYLNSVSQKKKKKNLNSESMYTRWLNPRNNFARPKKYVSVRQKWAKTNLLGPKNKPNNLNGHNIPNHKPCLIYENICCYLVDNVAKVILECLYSLLFQVFLSVQTWDEFTLPQGKISTKVLLLEEIKKNLITITLCSKWKERLTYWWPVMKSCLYCFDKL